MKPPINYKTGHENAFKWLSSNSKKVPKHLRGTRSILTRWFGRAVLTVFGWNVVGTIPDVKRVLIIAAPHTSNWDFVFAMAAVLCLNLRIRWLGEAYYI
jgi:1-acyl-sn-glycerol-3-phosphate acyltransferase